jgi:hypothetical protein
VKSICLVVLLAISSGMDAACANDSVGNFVTGRAVVDRVESGSAVSDGAKSGHVAVRFDSAPVAQITLDDSLAARLRRRRLTWTGGDDDSTAPVLAQHVQASFSKSFSVELNAHGIVSDNMDAPTVAEQPTVVIEYSFTAIDEGNRGDRIMIGLGRGASRVKMHVNVYEAYRDHRTALLAMDVDSDSGKMPGALPTMGAGSLVTGTGLGIAGDTGSTVDADASRLGKLVGRRVEALLGKQHVSSTQASQAL